MSDVNEEDLKLVAGLADQVNQFGKELARDSSDGFRENNSRPDSVIVDKRKVLTDMVKGGGAESIPSPTIEEINQAPYTPSPDDGFGDNIPIPPSRQHPQPQARPQVVQQNQQVGGNDFPFPPTLASTILRKITSIEVTVNKIVEMLKEADKKE